MILYSSVQKTEKTHKEQKQLLFWHVMKNNFSKYFYILFYDYISLNENAMFYRFFNKLYFSHEVYFD